ncbi:tRNA modification GTPase MnmE [Erysiphe neolycopersici]|uniref:tRNA modification GTPase MnmE n=1 Tax=Erysiphe neolycopersici TaxID=212602 RepID=A0A420HIW6_9PEZI|nr:tRNA modification GTPase MnmE [Erysiphe neolycopersici]
MMRTLYLEYPPDMILSRARIKNLAFYNLDDYHGFLTRNLKFGQRSILQHQKFSSNYSVPLASADDTIYALSTAPGRGALAIIRASGPQSIAIYNNLCPNSLNLHPRKAIVRKLYNPINPKIIVDSAAVILYYPAPSSATGEDVLELHIHGGSATQRAVLTAISDVASSKKLLIRYAEPGEFTKRAFLNHKLELAQVEALSNELSAETEQQRQAAVRSNPRMLNMIYEGWRNKLLLARGEIEALIDFSEDQNFEESPQKLLGNVRSYVDLILTETERLKHASYRQELLKRGVRVSLLGPPNSGKSSLLNRITGREASIVSKEAGTTRDVIEISLDIKGYLCTFADTAGLRDESTSSDSLNNNISAVEQEGIRRAKSMAKNSDILILMASFEYKESSEICMIKYDQSSLFLAANASNALIVVNKCDKVISSEQLKSLIEDFQTKITTAFSPRKLPPVIPICCHDNPGKGDFKNNDDNIQCLLSKLLGIIEGLTEFPVEMEDLIGVTERQRLILEKFGSHLQDFKGETDIVLAAENLRLAASCISRITGRSEEGDIDELLGVIFEKFCIGK